MEKPRGITYIIAAASGTGKTSLAKALTAELAAELKNLTISISHTTRPIRNGEENGKNYFFIDRTEFEKMIKEDGFLEYAEVFNYYYGTSKDFVEEKLAAGIDIILDIDWQGALQIKKKIKDSISIFLLPPSLQELQKRLLKRNRDPMTVVEHRMKMAGKEIAHCSEFDYIVMNENFDDALDDLRAIIKAKRLQTKTQLIKYKKLLDELTKSV